MAHWNNDKIIRIVIVRLLKWHIEIVIKLSELLLFSHNLMQAYIARKSTLKKMQNV